MKLGIVGFGVVGRATAEAFRRRRHEVLVHDIANIEPEWNYSLSALADACEAIFICVPTPQGEDYLSQVSNVIYTLSHYVTPKNLVVIKSTVPPKTTCNYKRMHPDMRIACNPEFLRQNAALQDALKPDRLVIGTFNGADRDLLKEIYNGWDCPKLYVDPTTAEFIKYASNMFLVAKVAYALEIQRVAAKTKANPVAILKGVGLDRRIGYSHLDPERGRIPVDTPCLAKDMQAFLNYLHGNGDESKLLSEIWKIGVEQEKWLTETPQQIVSS